VHVPYKGASQATADLLAGQIQLSGDNVPTALPQVRAGKLIALGVMGDREIAAVPDVPTVAESGLPGFEANGWLGILVPNGTPPAVIARLNAEIAKVMQAPETKKQLLASGVEARSGTPEQFGALIKSETAKWGKIISDAGIKE